MTGRSRTGVLGGTFDPVHIGHLAVAREAWAALGLDEVLLLPLRVPAHRPSQPAASVFHRFGMAASAALAATFPLRASDIELSRPGTTYTADTLRALHASGYGAGDLFFLIGADAFAEIATWREYPALLDLAHFVVCTRPGWPLDAIRGRRPELTARMTDVPAGQAAARVAARVAAEGGPATRVYLLDRATPDVSSTTIRARARAGQPIADLVPPEVDHYIRRHGLYGTSSPAESADRSAAGNLHE